MENFRSRFHKILQFPRVYALVQNLVGDAGLFARICAQVIKPGSGDHLLDLGCGTGTLLRHLPDDVGYLGLDINERYLQQARAEFAGKGEFLCCNIDDAREKLSGRRFDLVIAMGVLHHLSDSQGEAMLSVAHDLLSSRGKIITLDPVLLPDQNPLARFLISRDRGCWVRTPAAYSALPRDFPAVKTRVYHDLLRVPYHHFCMELSR